MVPYTLNRPDGGGPLAALEQRILQASVEIEHWFRSQWLSHTPPFYASVDIRNAGFKLSVVDTNLFPGGFNNLSEHALPLAVQAMSAAVERRCPDARRFLLIPESHTRNTYYLSNVSRLVALLKQSGLEVRIGTLIPEITQPTPIDLPDGSQLLLEPLQRRNDRLGVEGFDPCAILLNNDLSAGIPAVLSGIKGQQVIPPLHAGWSVRRKSQHFAAYSSVVRQFAERLQIDPWVLDPFYATCSKVDFHAREGESCLADNISTMLDRIRIKYRELGVQQTPFVVVKADAGTYGMGIMMVKDAQEIVNLNRKQRNKMAVVKEGLAVSDVLIQEGVPTVENVDEAVAEPVVYMVDRYVVGGFYRIHAERGPDENLNAPGMKFVPLPFDESCMQPDQSIHPDAAPNRYYVYGVIARLALLAASLELEQARP
ncbi:MAG: glutamate--cysteine ligase [Burkholderiaceae bacterium]|jgi:glutamate--cysteine ligase|nr:glutamate--cysteine ligase [Burkholderiaceae bacterium]